MIYLDGNSLGPLPKAALRELKLAAEQEWGEGLIRSWNAAGWFDLPVTLGDRLARLIGAGPGETVCTDTTSINIYKALHAALSLRPGRSTIVAEGTGFPTDVYIAEGVASVRPRRADQALLASMRAISRTCSAMTSPQCSSITSTIAPACCATWRS